MLLEFATVKPRPEQFSSIILNVNSATDLRQGETMSDLDIKRLFDHREIGRTLIAYCVHLDHMDLAALADLFTANCEVDYGNDPHLRSMGRASLAKSLERMWRWTRTSHHLANVMIDFEGDNAARATSYVFAWHERPDGSTVTMMGQYHDRLERAQNRWLIARRRMTMNGSDREFSVPIHRTDRLMPPDGWIAPDIDLEQ